MANSNVKMGLLGQDAYNGRKNAEELRRLGQKVAVLIGTNAQVPLKTVFYLDLTAAELAAQYDATGKGRVNTAGWGLAVCNGANGTRDLINAVLLGSLTAGTVGVYNAAAAGVTITLIPVMRIF